MPDDRLAYFEWSIDDEAWHEGKITGDEVELWAQANPAMDVRISREYIAAEMQAMGGARSETFARERLGVGTWPSTMSDRWEVVSRLAWRRVQDPNSVPQNPMVFGVDISPDRGAASISVGAKRADGLYHLELADHRPGTGWLVNRVEEIWQRWAPMAIVVAAGAAETIVDDLLNRSVSVEVVPHAEWTIACGRMYDAIVDLKSVRVRPSPDLDLAMGGAKKRPVDSGAAWTWSRQASTVILSPLIATTCAYWGVAVRPAYDPLNNIF